MDMQLLASNIVTFLIYREEYRPLTIQSNVSCEEKILLVLNDHSQYRVTRSAEYGKKSYNMMHPQTDKGVSKFFSILRFMVNS